MFKNIAIQIALLKLMLNFQAVKVRFKHGRRKQKIRFQNC